MPENNPFIHDNERSEAPLTEDEQAWDLEQKKPYLPEVSQSPELIEATRMAIEAIIQQEDALVEKQIGTDKYQKYLEYYNFFKMAERNGGDSSNIEPPDGGVEQAYQSALTEVHKYYNGMRFLFIDSNVAREGEAWKFNHNYDHTRVLTSYYDDTKPTSDNRATRYAKRIGFDLKGQLIEENYEGAYDEKKASKLVMTDNEIKNLNLELGQIIDRQHQALQD